MTAGAVTGATGQMSSEIRRNEGNSAGNIAGNPANSGKTVNHAISDSAAIRMRYTQFIPQADSRDVVSLSSFVPQPFPARTLEDADAVADKLLGGEALKRQENTAMNESNILRALVAMRLFQKNGGNVSENIWVSGLQQPNPAEMHEAYRRLTQRVIGVDNAQNIDAARQMRLDMLDQFRNCNWSTFTPFAAAPAVA